MMTLLDLSDFEMEMDRVRELPRSATPTSAEIEDLARKDAKKRDDDDDDDDAPPRKRKIVELR